MKNSKMKKSLSLILSLIMIMSTLSVLTVTSFAETTSDGIVYDSSGGTTVVTGYTGTKTSVTIPSQLGGKTVTAINSFVSDKVTSVTLPSTITEIKENAFKGSSKLAKVTLNEGLQTIGYYAFSGTAIKEVTVPSTVTSMQYYSFGSDKHYSAFFGANSLSKVIFADGMTAIPEYALYNCSSVQQVILPNSITTIGQDAFYNCTLLKEIALPSILKTIGAYAFYNCTSLENLTLPTQLNSIESGAFMACSSITELVMPDSLNSIGKDAFNSCSKLETVELNEGLQTIGGYAFSGTAIKEVTVPSTVTSMQYYSFGSDKHYSAFFGANSLSKVIFADGMTAIPEYALYGCDAIETVEIPNSVTAINKYAFGGCTSLEEITLPTKLKSIGDYSFYGCSALIEVKMPDKVTSIGQLAFAGCSRLEAVELNEGLQSIGYYAFNGTKIKEITVPSTVTSMQYYSFGSDKHYSAFFGANSLSKVVFADGMTTIPEYALYGCDNIETVEFPNSVTTINKSAFDGCTSLEEITLPTKLKTIGDSAFSGCSELIEVIIPKKTTSIGVRAFSGCSRLESVELNEGLQTIGYQAFNGTRIKEVTIPSTVTSMGSSYSGSRSAFYGANLLNRVIFADGMTAIPEYALYGCENVEEIVMHKTITSVGTKAFADCTSLEDVYGYNGTFAETFANDNGYNFIPLDGICLHSWTCTYEWSADNKKVTATKVCKNDPSHTDSETVNVKSSVIRNATCEDTGKTTLTASFTKDGFVTQRKSVEIPAKGHSWNTATYTWSDDKSTCTATRTCKNDSKHVETETVNTTSEITVQPITTSTGKMVYTAEFKNEGFKKQTKTVTLDKLPDTYKGFPDVKKGDWYYDVVKYVAEKGFITGYQSGKFGPNDALKRQDFVCILARIDGADLKAYENVQSKLTDVKKGDYYAAAVNWAVDKGYISGYKNGKFGVNDPITREQVATILYNYMGKPEVKDANKILAKFPDANKVSSFAKTPVAWAVSNGIISGMGDGTVASTSGATRAQIAAIIQRMDTQGMFDK